MALPNIIHVTGRAVYVPGDDIDTDRIIPARFMKCITFDGLGEYLFYDARRHEDGSDREHPLNNPRHLGAKVLVSGSNFGCGSSREHAPQAIYRHGFHAVIAQSFAEIFFGNCTTLGMPCVCASAANIALLAEAIEANPELEVRVDVAARHVIYGSRLFSVTMPESARDALIKGQWDPVTDLMSSASAVDAKLKELAYV